MVKKVNTRKRKNASKKRKVSFDIIELLDGKVNKYWVILGFIVLFFVLSLVYLHCCPIDFDYEQFKIFCGKFMIFSLVFLYIL